MNRDPDFLYDLVPAIYRLRDPAHGSALRALLRVIAEQADVVERDIAQLYENWFIETCEDWVVPYIGALVGYTPVATGPDPGTGTRALARERITIPRREVANTIRFRRRKGTLSVLPDLAQAVALWPALAVEFYRLLAVTQNIDYLHMDRGRTAELRDVPALDLLGTAFDTMARNVDVRRVDSARTQGTANIPEVGLFVWRLRAYTVTRAPAYCYEEEAPNCFLFSALGNDTPLFVNPEASGANPKLPLPITRRAMDDTAGTSGPGAGVASYYGGTQSIMIWTGPQNAMVAVDPARIVPADLSGWRYRPTGTQVALDPMLGRIVFPPNQSRRQAVWVSYAYGFSADIGGGQYDRPLSQPAGAVVYQVRSGLPQAERSATKFARLGDALTQWRQDKPPSAIIEILDSNVYAEPVAIDLLRGQTLELRAASGARPIIRLLEWQTATPDDLSIAGEAGSWFVLDGILVTGRGVQVGGDVSGVTIRHCTLVPGWGLDCGCGPLRPTEPSLEIVGAPLCITIEHSILGAIQVERDETAEDPLRIRISDSIVDATDPERVALGASGKLCAYAVLELRRCTVFGELQTHMIELAQDSIILGLVRACRRQAGCMRFCYVPPGSRTPRRYECQPDLVLAAVADLFAQGGMTAAERDALQAGESLRVAPEFDSVRYGTPTYARLALGCAPEITAGASDQSEMGVFHDLYQPQRAANLRQRLDEYTPAGSDAGIIYAS
jgi:hypothetical protein